MALLKLIAANDVIGAQVAVIDALAGKHCLFITAPETNGLMPEVHGLPDSEADSVCFIVESSGSTGRPKRIRHTAAAAFASASLAADRLGGHGQWLLALPINYVAGLNVLVRSAVAETMPVVMNTSVGFTAEAFVRHASMLRGDRRYTSLVPTQLLRLAQAAEFDEEVLRALRGFDAILVGGQSVAPALTQQLRDLHVNIVETYGSAETFGGVVYDGVPLESVFVSIEPDERIAISSPTLSIDEQPKFVSNDIGELVDEKLRVLGRKDRVIISGGIKISLDRVEALVSNVAGVVEVAATALNDDEWGQRVGIAYLGSPEVADDVATELANLLGPAAKPLRVIRVDRVPKLENQKHDLIAIQALFDR
ncbi:MAG: AMP-binding protein [Micrococcales bacterium]